MSVDEKDEKDAISARPHDGMPWSPGVCNMDVHGRLPRRGVAAAAAVTRGATTWSGGQDAATQPGSEDQPIHSEWDETDAKTCHVQPDFRQSTQYIRDMQRIDLGPSTFLL